MMKLGIPDQAPGEELRRRPPWRACHASQARRPHAAFRPARSRLALGITLALLSGCVTYAPAPLGHGRGASDVAHLEAPTGGMPIPALANYRFDPSDGLDVTEVAMLAVVNSPDLKLKRDQLGISRAQAFAAGLLPDPQLSLGEDFPRHSSAGLTTAFNLGLSEDLGALLTRSSRKAAARNEADQVNLDLLWAEWQTVAQARLLFGQVRNLRAQQVRLASEQAALDRVATYVRAALDAGNLTYDSASAGLNTAADMRKLRTDNAIALHQADSELHVLLGLAPTAPLDLVGAPYRVAPTFAQLQQALAGLPRRRPDLLALQAGYQSQEAKLRGAVLAQFPALNIGFNTARDTSAVYTQGFSIGITLPLFDRNRGNIAIEQATRQQLRDAYEVRVLTTRSDMQRLAADLATLDRQRDALTAHAKQLADARRAAEQSWQQGLLDWPTWLAIRSQSLTADLDLLAVQQQQATQSIALEALLGNTELGDTAHPVPAQASTP